MTKVDALGLSLTICLFHFVEVLCTFVHSLILKYLLYRHNFLIYTHMRTYRRTNTRPDYGYWVYSRRPTTFVLYVVQIPGF